MKYELTILSFKNNTLEVIVLRLNKIKKNLKVKVKVIFKKKNKNNIL